jgi:ketosteroid isomerase-like protein
MKSNRDIVTDAFRSWANGDGYVASIFADDMTWEITGRSAVSKKYADTQQFIDEVLHPFGARSTNSGTASHRDPHGHHEPQPGERSPSRH